jgi:hypothetical protein
MITKQLDIAGETYIIAPLNVKQVRAHVITDEDAPGDAWVRGYDLICCGLNNASAKQQWTHERVETELPWLAYHQLQREILALSGFAQVSTDPPKGEAPAPLSPTVQ